VPAERTFDVVSPEDDLGPEQILAFLDAALKEVLGHQPVDDKLEVIKIVQVELACQDSVTDR
jgi:hypothetical protein